MGLIAEGEEENYGLNRMTKKAILDSCKKNKLYITPNLNDVLYLHFQGYQKIESLEEYTGLKCLWLESNAITEISGLDNQSLLRCLFLHNNLIEKIENLEGCKELDTLNLSHNQVSHLLNCGSDILPVLNTLNIANNYLRTAESIEILRNCHHLSVLDLSNNRLDDILIVKIFADMHDLKVLILTGNPVVNDIPSYRKTLIVECKKLTYLDTRPVFPRDRACAEAWRRGGFQEERQENIRWNKEERREMLRSVNATLRMRNRGGGEPEVQLIPTDSSDDDEFYSREMRPKQCEDISSTEQWNMMDEMMRNPESSDKYQSCKVCGSAFCKYQHIESHAEKKVKDAELSTEEIIESSNFSALWGEDNYKVLNENVTTESVCEGFKEEVLEKEALGGASCSYTNNPVEKQIASQNTEETNDAECYVNNTTTVISGNEQPKVLQNITELVKGSMFTGDCDSDDDSNASITDCINVIFNSNEFPGEGKIPQINAEQCPEMMSSDQNTVNITESPEIDVHVTENVIIKNVYQISEDESKSSDQTTINITGSLEVVGHLTENNIVEDVVLLLFNNIEDVCPVLNKFEDEKKYSDQSHDDEAIVNVTETAEMVEYLTENIVVEDVHQIIEDEKKYPDQSQEDQIIMNTTEYPEMVESMLNIFEDEKKYLDQSHDDETNVNITESLEIIEHLTENVTVEDMCQIFEEEKKNPAQNYGDQTAMILKISEDEKEYSDQIGGDEAIVNITESLEMIEHLTEHVTVEDVCQIFEEEKKNPAQIRGDQTAMNTSEYPEMVESILKISEGEKNYPDQIRVDEATVNITESPDVCQIHEDVKDDIPIENVETNLGISLECFRNVQESIYSFKAKFKKGMEHDCALEYHTNFATIYTKEHENEITAEQTFKSSDLSTLWEENSLAELDGNDSYIESYDNEQTEIVDKLEKEKDNCIEAICSINVPDATCLYQVKFDDPVKENISNLVQYNNLSGQIGERFEDVNVNHAVIETIENENSEILANFKCTIPKIEAADEFIEDNLEVPVEYNVNTEFENFNYNKKKGKNSQLQQDNDFLIARIKKNCFELNEMLGSTAELNKAVTVAKMQDDDDEDESPEEFEDIDNSSRIETLGYSSFVTSFEQFFNENEPKSAELMNTVDFSILYTSGNDTSSIDNVKAEEKPACDMISVDEIPAMKNFREYRAHLKTLLNRDSELRESCNELLNEINERLEMIEAIDKPPLADDVSLTELPVNPNNSLLSSSNSFYKICYDDPNSSLDFVSIGNDIEGNNAPDPNSSAVEETEDDESSEV